MRLQSLAETVWVVTASLVRLPALVFRLLGSLQRLKRAHEQAAKAFEDELRHAGLSPQDAKVLADAFPKIDLGEFTGQPWRVPRRLLRGNRHGQGSLRL